MLSKGREVVGSGYSRLTGATAKVTDRGIKSGNAIRVNWVSKMEQHYPSRVSQVGRVSQVNQDSNIDLQADQVSQVSQDNRTDQQADRVSQNSSMDR
jgi:hypothetical protein